MSRRATERRARRERASRSRRGSAILGTLVVIVALVGLVAAASTTSIAEVRATRHSLEGVRAKYLAEAGLERGLAFLSQSVKGAGGAPFAGISALFAGGTTRPIFVAEPLLEGASQVGAYSVSLTRIASTATSITIAIDATGYVPDAPAALEPGREVLAWRAQRCTVRYTLAPSEVFDYAYFLNNWGWFYGNTIRANGNVRSNGQFDAAGYKPTITGTPLYASVQRSGGTVKLSGYEDDNGDGLRDGEDGGIWSGWDIVNAKNVTGNGGRASNQHDFDEQVAMPNLSDLSHYEAAAIAQKGKITVGGSTVCDGVLGDQAGEKQHLYLVGTAAKPIVLDGPVVVRGDVVISGVVTGKGAIYAGRNVYCPKSVTYKNAPATPRPANNTQAATEAWLTSNWDRDFLGLFARENGLIFVAVAVRDRAQKPLAINVKARQRNASEVRRR